MVLGPPVILQHSAQPRHCLLQRMGRIRWRAPRPHVIDKPLGRHHLPGPQQQRNQQRTLPAAGHTDRVARALHHKRPQHLEPQGTPNNAPAVDVTRSSAGAF